MIEDNNESFMEIDGNKVWRNNLGLLNRTNGPAVEYINGSKFWYIDGKRHRADGPAIEDATGSKYWYEYDKLHRTDGPAIDQADGSKAWYIDGKRHRTDGPELELKNGYKEWWINGIYLFEEEFEYWSKDWNEEKEIMFKLSYS